VGPGPSIPNQSLPGNLGQGVLIDMANQQLTFGPNPGAPLYSLNGSPITTLYVDVGNTGTVQAVPSIVDSGGVFGTMPSSVIGSGSLPANTVINVYDSAAKTHLLYTYNTNNYQPTVISSGLMNTGFLPYATHPIYIDFGGAGTTVVNS
jgi:hypothetical protein